MSRNRYPRKAKNDGRKKDTDMPKHPKRYKRPATTRARIALEFIRIEGTAESN